MKYINILFLICGLNSQSIIIIDRISTIFDIPSFGGNIIGYTNKGDQFEFRSERGGWYEISLNNDIGYIYIPKVKESTINNEQIFNLNQKIGYGNRQETEYVITEKATLIFENPYINNINKKIKKGTSLELIHIDKRWYHVRHDGKNGYVSKASSKLEQTSKAFPNEGLASSKNNSIQQFELLITTEKDNIRKGPSTNYSVIGKCYKGERYKIIKKEGDWYKIQLGDSYGYTHGSNGVIEKLDYFITQKANYDDIALPLIPVYFDNGGYIKSLLPNGYYEVFSRDKAFIEIKIEKEYLISKNIRAITPFAIYFISSFKMVNEDYSSFGILAGSLIVGTLSYFILKESYSLNAAIQVKNNNVTVNTLIGKQSVFPVSVLNDIYPIWSEIIKIAEKYVEKFDKQLIDYTLSPDWKALGNPKGEFETTPMYKDRLKKEKFEKERIITDYKQRQNQLEEKFKTNKIRLKRSINEMLEKFTIKSNHNFTLTRYDADKQEFAIHINNNNVVKKIQIPLSQAPFFKEKKDDLIVYKRLNPTNIGSWISIDDDYVLYSNYTKKVIPWGGEISPFVQIPVSNPPNLEVKVGLTEPSGEGFLDAEEVANLKITLTNKGLGPSNSIRISVSQESGPILYYDVSATVNSIAPGESYMERFQITVPENISDGKVSFTVSFLEAQGFEPQPVKFTAEVRAQREPLLTLVDFGVVDQSGDGKVNKGESAEITARIQNKGQGMAKSVRVNINPEGNDVFMHPDSKKEFNLGNIPAGEARDVTFTILTNNRVGDMASIELKLNEKRPRFSKSEFVKLEIDKQQSQLAPLAFTGTSSYVAIEDLATLTVDIEKDIPKGKKSNPNALAIVFGVENYKNVSAVTFAKRDATYMKEYFEKVLGIPSNRIYFKTNDDVGKAEFDKVFSKDGWLDKRVKEGKTDLYIYYAGHGAPDIKKNKAYLIPYDGDPNYASQTGLEMNALYSELLKMNAKSVTVFLDACFSGANREGEPLLADARGLYIEVDPGFSGNITIFSASSGKEISSAWPEKKHGLFSYFLMKGMRGDADANKDRQITVDELSNYVRENVSEMAGMLDREQTPGLQTMNREKVLIRY